MKKVAVAISLVWFFSSGFYLSWTQDTAFAQVPTCANAIKATPMGPFPCSVRLDWQDNSDNETTFIIDRSLNGTLTQGFATVGANIRTATDATLQQSATMDNNYCYQIRAGNLDANGKPQASAPSNQACMMIPKAVPVAVPVPNSPSGLSTAAVGQTVIRVSWSDNSDNETGFDIERWTSKPTITTVMFSVPADTVNWDNTGLTKGRTFCYRVRAKNGAGDSPYSNQSCGTTNR